MDKQQTLPMALPVQTKDATAQVVVKDGISNINAHTAAQDRSLGLQLYHDSMPLGEATADSAYRNSGLTKKIVDIVANDAIRGWRGFDGATPEQSIAIEALERKLDIPRKVLQAYKNARLYGGSALFIAEANVPVENLYLPLNPDRIAEKGIAAVNLIKRNQLATNKFDKNVVSPNFDQPIEYLLTAEAADASGQTRATEVRIHPSRLVIFKGDVRLSPYQNQDLDSFLGDSILKARLQDIKDVELLMANIHALIFEAKVAIVKVPELIENLENRDDADEYEESIIRVGKLLQHTKGNAGLAFIDAGMEYQQHNFNYAGLSDIFDRTCQMLAAVTDIPLTRLFGTSAKGLNATGEGDMKNYIANVKAIQAHDIQPSLAILDQCLLKSAGVNMEGLTPKWNSVMDMSIKEKADAASALMDVIIKADGYADDNKLGDAATAVLTDLSILEDS